MDFNQFLSWAFPALLSSVLIYGVKVLQDIKTSVDELNERMATIIERTAWHEKEMERLNDKILWIEKRLTHNC